jgi:hypothetical protein
MDRRGIEVRVEGLASMDEGNGEEQARLRSMNYEGHMKLWRVPYVHIIHVDQTNCWYTNILSGLVEWSLSHPVLRIKLDIHYM